ncbi:hypothetical protein MTO96_036324 [Rhipicephalus appendiculatus]
MGHPYVEPKLHEEFTVEVCIVVSENYSTSFNSTEDLVQYVGALLNWAAIPYFDMECPRIRLQINEIIKVQMEYSEEEYSDATEESTTVFYNEVYEDSCRPDVMLDGMACGENKTCYRSNCSHHNWTEIRLKYYTLRTFP